MYRKRVQARPHRRSLSIASRELKELPTHSQNLNGCGRPRLDSRVFFSNQGFLYWVHTIGAFLDGVNTSKAFFLGSLSNQGVLDWVQLPLGFPEWCERSGVGLHSC